TYRARRAMNHVRKGARSRPVIRFFRTSSISVSVASVAIACGSGSSSSSTPEQPFRADPPAVYVAKVKNLLVGLPPTDEEVSAVTRDAGALRGLIDGWIGMPEYRSKMLRFFELAFQQTQVSITDF